MEDMITAKLLPNRNAIIFLCKDKLLIIAYHKNLNALAFMLKGI